MKWTRLLLVALVGTCLTGCATRLGHHGEVGVRYGTEVTFFSRASQTSDVEATAEIEVPALIDWLLKPKPEPGEPSDGTDG